MASEDVIELGSSDEDSAEPAAKKRKPPSNAMVHIPKNVTLGSEMTIQKKRKAKPVINPASIMKGSSVTITKVQKNSHLKVNPMANATKVNGNDSMAQQCPKPQQSPKPQQCPKPGLKRNLNIPVTKNPMLTGAINPLPPHLKINPATVKHITKINPKSVQQNVKMIGPQFIAGKLQAKPLTVGTLQMSTIKKPTLNSKLLPELVITRTSPSAKKGNANNITIKTQMKPNENKTSNQQIKILTMSNLRTIQVKSGSIKHNPSSSAAGVSQPGEVTTVDLDDDEPPPSSGPQWYLRPEEQDRDLKTEASNTETEPSNMETVESIEKSEQNPTEESRAIPESSTLEKQNNKEPDKSNYIEITIEDSPIKPLPSKKGFQVGVELPITIDDSPVRKKSKKTQNSHSDDEKGESVKESNRKKKLNYPVTDVHVVEIEFEPIANAESTSEGKDDENSQEVPLNDIKLTPNKDIDVGGKKQDSDLSKSEKSSISESSPKAKDKERSKPDSDKVNSPKTINQTSREEITVTTEKSTGSTCDKIKDRKKSVVECIDIVEIEESPIKPDEEVAKTTPKKNNISKPTYKMSKPIEIIDLDDKDISEFNPVYQSFIKLCLQLENSDDMKKIVEKKIKAYYRQVPKDYTESDVFIDMVGGKIMAMKAAPEKMYLYIKDVVDELNVQRKMAKEQPAKEKNEEQEKFLYGEESEFDSKRQRQIRKLEKTLKKLHRAIQKLEEQEVDFDDEEDSVYLLTERYKERSVRVHAKLCQLTNTKMPSEARVIIDPRPGQPKGPAKRLEKWINRKVPIGTPLPFPDFHDVLRCVREANKEDDIGWNEADVMEEARDLFVRCGKKLQRRRQENEWRVAASRVPPDSTDPVEEDCELRRKLEENKRLAARKETEVFNKYADRQKQLKLEAVEIGDKEAEESPVESDDEVEEVIEVPDTDTDKQKRKERIKRLLKNSKVSNDKVDKRNPDDKKIKEQSPECDNVIENSPKDSSKAESSGDKEKSKEDKIEGESSKSRSKSDSEDDDVKSGHENNLLERRYSVSNNSNSSSDSESPIAIDTSSSDEIESKKPSSDVISIENSSLSESEEKKDDGENEKEDDETNSVLEKIDEETEVRNEGEIEDSTNDAAETPMDISMEIDSSENKKKEKISNKAHKDYNGLSEEVLLASTDEEEDETGKADHDPDTCINLRDDTISIGETMIVENREIDASDDSKESKSDKNTDNSSVEGMEIGPSEIVSKKCDLETVTEEVKSLDAETHKILETSQTDKEQIAIENTNIHARESSKEVTDNAEYTDDKNDATENVNETICLSSVESVDSGNMNEIDDNIPEVNDDIQDKNDKPSDKSSGDYGEVVIEEDKNLGDENENVQNESDAEETNKTSNNEKDDNKNENVQIESDAKNTNETFNNEKDDNKNENVQIESDAKDTIETFNNEKDDNKNENVQIESGAKDTNKTSNNEKDDNKNENVQIESDAKDTNETSYNEKDDNIDNIENDNENLEQDKENIQEGEASEKYNTTNKENLKENDSESAALETKENNNSVAVEAMDVDPQESL